MREIYLRFWGTFEWKDDSAVQFARDLGAVCPKLERFLTPLSNRDARRIRMIGIERGPGGDIKVAESLIQVFEKDGFQIDFAKRHLW